MKLYVSLAYLRPWRHFTTLMNTAVHVTIWVQGKKNIPVGPALSHRLYFGQSRSNSNFHQHVSVFNSFFFYVLLVINDSIFFPVSKYFFFGP